MLRHKVLTRVAPLIFLATPSLFGSNVQVGTCKPHLKSFPTISAAVSGVSAGSTIQVCPGTYAEQVTITQPLTLEGVNVGTANQALITVPSGGLLPNTTSIFGESVAAQILVLGAGPVNISNLAVDGTGGDMGCLSNIWVAGIFYGSGASGTISRLRASGQIDGSCGVGIWAENGDSSTQTVTIRDSSVYNTDSAGIFVGSGATPTLSVDINHNVVNTSSALASIFSESVDGVVSSNDISNALIGVFDDASTVNVTTNTIAAPGYGLFLLAADRVSGNHISGADVGVAVGAGGATITGNRIVSSTTSGIELGCLTGTVSGNFINDAPVGIDQAPAGIGPNSFANTATTITNGCAVAALARQASTAMATPANLPEQWHTPATPFGTRTK